MITHSKYYSSAFNSAIFDGPIRIYFAQYQESVALKLYLKIQQELKYAYDAAKEINKRSGLHIFIMMYPTHETFEMCFDGIGKNQKIVTAKLEEDYVLGINGTLNEETYETIFFYIKDIIEGFNLPQETRSAVEEVVL